ncbi:MAG: hypothetical protein M1556_01240 [Candidatus Thermoplasmatota archaeon]|jgi:hypothetical protein|nr:hypothetical protein [Candidatus Thermoplasmatota archaeon]MCL6002259.1 hypothetical protein [Candidatus Thermoplasmatota archaeon]
MPKIGKNGKLVLALLIVSVMLGSVFVTSAYAAAPPFTGTFSTTGLPTGATAYVGLANSSRTAIGHATAGTNIVVSGLYNGTYVLNASAVEGSGAKYSALVWVPPSSKIIGISEAYTDPTSLVFNEEFLLNFTETGLASGTTWSVLVGSTEYSSTGSYLDVNELNGTYSYSIIGISGYSVTPLSGSIVISGGNVTVPLTYSSTGKTFAVTFNELNLPGGTVWSIMLNGVASTYNSASASYPLTNGTYFFKIPDAGQWYGTPSSGTIVVSGKAITQNITFKYGYLVSFTSTNLAKYVQWSVAYNGTSNSSTSNTITFFIANGSYKFSVSVAQNWIATPSSGYLNVSGNSVSLSIGFTEVFYMVTFKETGLPSNTLWTITVNNQIYQTTNGSVVITAHNGSFSYTVATESGYKASPSSGTVNLGYSSVVETIVYASTVKSTTGNGSGGIVIPPAITSFIHAYGYYIVAGIVIAVLIGILLYEAEDKKSVKKPKGHYK